MVVETVEQVTMEQTVATVGAGLDTVISMYGQKSQAETCDGKHLALLRDFLLSTARKIEVALAGSSREVQVAAPEKGRGSAMRVDHSLAAPTSMDGRPVALPQPDGGLAVALATQRLQERGEKGMPLMPPSSPSPQRPGVGWAGGEWAALAGGVGCSGESNEGSAGLRASVASSIAGPEVQQLLESYSEAMVDMIERKLAKRDRVD